MNLFGIFWLFWLTLSPDNTVRPDQKTDPCRVYGAIYIEEYPENAQFLVFEEESEAFAGMLVFEEDNRLMADKSGKWHFTDNRAFARYSVYFVDKKNHADFSVYFTNFESMAGCRK